MLIENEQAYPIYTVNARWSQDGIQDPNYPNWHKDLPEGRIWNGTGFSFINEKELSDAELIKIATDWWDKYSNSEGLKDKHIDNLVLDFKLKEWEVWNLTWFSHETFDNGQTDLEALASFERFVHRKERLNYEHRDPSGLDKYCLMGAEDRWRWHGSNADGSRNEDAPAPCRCKYCKEQKKIRINH